MKKYIFNLATALLFGAGLMVSSCGKEGETVPSSPEPNFPEKVTPTIEAGQTHTLEIEPNGSWEVSIPTSGDASKWFWIQDGSQKAFSVRGNEGKHSIVIATLNQPDYDNPHSCDVTMKMKGSDGQTRSQVIATISIGKLIPQISVYTCKMEEDDIFLFNPEYDFTQTDNTVLKYSYNETATTEVELIWPYASSNYQRPILVEGNFNWAVIGKLPEWLSDLTISSGKPGEKKEIRLSANLKALPANGAEATITLGDANKSFPIKVKIPAYTKLFKTEYPIEVLFNSQGEYFDVINQNFVVGNAYGMVASAKDIKFMVFAEVENGSGTKLDYQSPAIDWVTPIDVWDNTTTTLAQNRRVEFAAAKNTGKARKAIVLGVPASIAATTTPAQMIQGSEIAENFKQYIITTIKQMEYFGIIGPKDLPSALLQSGAQFTRLAADAPIFGDFNVTGDAYNLIYTISWSHTASTLIFEKPFTSYKCYDYNKNLISSDSWLTVTSDGKEKPQVTIVMDKNKIGAGANANKGYIVFSDASGNFAVVQCTYDEGFDIPLEDPGFVNPTAAVEDGSTLVKLTSGPLYDQYKDKGVPIWHLTFKKSAATMSMVTNLPKFAAPQDQQFLSYNYSGAYSVIGMSSKETKTSAIFLYADQANTRIKLVLVCTLKLN